MAVKMRLRREGKKKQPFYRVVVADVRSPRDGRFIEDIGYYQPLHEPSSISIDRERALHWLRHGAQPSSAVVNLLRIQGVWEEFRPNDPGKDRSAKRAAVAAEKAARARTEPAPADPPAAEASAAPAPREEVVEQAREEDTQPEPGPAEETGALPEGAAPEEGATSSDEDATPPEEETAS